MGMMPGGTTTHSSRSVTNAKGRFISLYRKLRRYNLPAGIDEAMAMLVTYNGYSNFLSMKHT